MQSTVAPESTPRAAGPLQFAPSAAGEHALTPGEVAAFKDKGWIGRYPLLTAGDVERVTRARNQVANRFTLPEQLAGSTAPDAFAKRPWYKSLHAHVPMFYDLACHPAVAGRVASLLGPDVMLWGLTAVESWPGKQHRWHVDVENLRWPGVTAYIGLIGMDQHSTLKVMEGSQRIGRAPQAFGVDKDDARALAAAQETVPDSRIVSVPLSPGEFFLFDGLIWHGSHNTGTDKRLAMIAHYARPDARVQIPLGFDEPVRWHEWPPPCVLVRGEDRHRVNRMVLKPGGRR